MSKATLRVLALLLATFLSFGIWFGSTITRHILHVMYGEQMYVLSPFLTRLALNWYWLLILIVCVFACISLVLSVRYASEPLVGTVGIAMPLLVSWLTIFSFSLEFFYGGMSLHHSAKFEFSLFLTSIGGFFPITFLLIVLFLVLCTRDALRAI